MAKILIADDDPDFVQIMLTILTSEGYDVVSASSGGEALRIMREDGIDIVLLDVMMASVLDGVGVAHEMQNDPALKGIKIMMISSIISSPHAAMFPTDHETGPAERFAEQDRQADRGEVKGSELCMADRPRTHYFGEE